MDELPTKPGYDKHGNWHGSATEEVLYWKRRALDAETRSRGALACTSPCEHEFCAAVRRQNEAATTELIQIEAGRAVLRRG